MQFEPLPAQTCHWCY